MSTFRRYPREEYSVRNITSQTPLTDGRANMARCNSLEET
jgi:hypothetical protein